MSCQSKPDTQARIHYFWSRSLSKKQLLGKQKYLMICIYKFNSIFLSAGSLCSCTLYPMKLINHGFWPLHPHLWSGGKVVQGLHCRCTVECRCMILVPSPHFWPFLCRTKSCLTCYGPILTLALNISRHIFVP